MLPFYFAIFASSSCTVCVCVSSTKVPVPVDSNHTTTMQSSTRATLCNLVEDNLTSLIREAATVQRHSRRARFRPAANAAGPTAGGIGGGGPLLPEGVDPNSPAAAALAGRVGVASSSGSSGAVAGASGGGGGPKRRRLLHADDINLALAHRGSEKLYLTNAGQIGGPTVTTAPKDEDGSTNNGNGTKKRKDAAGALTSVVDLNEYLKTEMTLRPPSEIGLRAHWLAVDGVQPDIPENPPPIGAVIEADDGPAGGAMGAGGAAVPQVGVGALRSYQQRDLTVHRVEDDEDLEAVAAAAGEDNKADSAGGGGGPSAGSGGGGAGGVSVRQLLPRLLSEELRLYFTRITLAVERGNPSQIESALAAIGRDSGIQELVPFFVRFVSRQIYDNVGRVEYCRTLVRLAKKLVSNPHLHLELNLHQLLPPLITCVVARRLAGGDGSDHWALREEAAEVLVAACST